MTTLICCLNGGQTISPPEASDVAAPSGATTRAPMLVHATRMGWLGAVVDTDDRDRGLIEPGGRLPL